MKRIVIEYDQVIETPVMAISRVLEIVKKGQVSNAIVQGYPCPHYCWVTTFQDNVSVIVRRKRRLMSADSFLVDKPLVVTE